MSTNNNIDHDDIEFVNQLTNVSKQLNFNSPQQQPVTLKKSGSNTPTTTTTTTTQQKHQRIDDIDDNESPIITDEDYAAELQSQFNKEQTNIDTSIDMMNLENQEDSLYLPEIIAQSSDYHRFIDLKRTATVIKAISALLMVFSIMSYFSEAWWLIFSGGLIFCPIGFYSAHYLQRRLFLLFILYLSVDIVFRLGYLFSHLAYLKGFGVFISLLFDALEGYMVYFCFNFYKRMPKDGRETYREFFLNDQGLFSL